MYTKTIPHKNFKGLHREQEVQFNLTEHEVLKLLVEFKEIFDWQERLEAKDPDAEVDTLEVMAFYNNFESVLLAAWGELDENGDHFRKGGVYDFRESSVFHAAMKLFLEDQAEANRLIDGLMPTGLKDLVKNVDVEEVKQGGVTNDALVNKLKAQLAAAQSAETPSAG